MAEAEAEGEPEGEPNNFKLYSSGKVNTSEVIPDRPSPAEIILPSLVLIIIIIITALAISCATQARWWKKKFQSGKKSKEFDDIASKFGVTRELEFLTMYDKKILETYRCFFNQPYFLLMISLPAIISLICCPVALYLYEPFIEWFWPSSMFEIIPKVNDVIACFLTPAGLVYAIAFGFAFQEAQTKQHLMTEAISNQVSLLNRIVMLTFVAQDLTTPQKQEIFNNVKNEVIHWMTVLLGLVRKEQMDCIHGHLYNSVNLMRQAMKRDEKTILLPKLNKVLLELDAMMSTRGKHAYAAMPIVQWMFLEVLGFFSFFGILLLRADSYKLELAMQIITVFSISFFCYILADLDSPYHGAFRVPLEILYTFARHLEQANSEISNGIPKARRGTRYSIISHRPTV